jgi:hypothetical protein
MTKKDVTFDVGRRLRSNFAGRPPRVTNSGSESGNVYVATEADLGSSNPQKKKEKKKKKKWIGFIREANQRPEPPCTPGRTKNI